MVVRLGWRLAHAPPPLVGMPQWQRELASWTHQLLYVSLIVQPVAGYLGSVFSGYPVKWFGVTLPAWGAPSVALKDAMSTVHLCNSFVLLALVLVHLAGALKHALARDGYLRRMLWSRRRSREAALGIAALDR
jgi:cytochrome b561